MLIIEYVVIVSPGRLGYNFVIIKLALLQTVSSSKLSRWNAEVIAVIRAKARRLELA